MPFAERRGGERQHVVLPELRQNEGANARFCLFDGLAAGGAEPIEVIGHGVPDTGCRLPTILACNLHEEVKFAADSLLEGAVRCPLKASFIAGLMNS
jgi:hypothetical protein